MICQGALIGFLGDWTHCVHLCIRIPKKRMLLISDPLSNPLVPQRDISFYEKTKYTDVSEAVREKFSKGQHPWAVDTDPGELTVLDVMAGATVVSLQLLCHFHGVDVCKLSELFLRTFRRFPGNMGEGSRGAGQSSRRYGESQSCAGGGNCFSANFGSRLYH
jgi:hypothetical protein